MNLVITGEGGEDEDARVWMMLQQRGGGFNSADAGKLKVHEDDVRLLFGEQFRCILAAIRLADDFEIVLEFQ